MRIQYAISLWNFSHYAGFTSLEQELSLIRELGYGVELWSRWRDGRNLYDVSRRAYLRSALENMPVSLHSAIVHSFPEHQAQVDAAQDLGASVLVVHSDEFFAAGKRQLDIPLCREVVAYAAERGVQIALENGQLPFLEQAIAAVEGLRVCLDVGHVYLTQEPLAAFLLALKSRIIHLHLHDTLTPVEADLAETSMDHHRPGSGSIPAVDWQLLTEVLKENDFDGTAVFEIRPRTPYQTARLGARFFDALLGVGPLAANSY